MDLLLAPIPGWFSVRCRFRRARGMISATGCGMRIMDCNAPETSSVHNAPFCACKLWVPGGGRRRAHGQKQREIVGCVKYFTNVCDFINPRDTVPAVVVVNRDDANSTAMRRRHASAPGVPDPLTEFLQRCADHPRPPLDGADDTLVMGPLWSGYAQSEGGGEENRAACDLIHRPPKP